MPSKGFVDYACADSDATLRLYNKLYPLLTKRQKQTLAEIDYPLVPILAAMERVGVAVDVGYLKSIRDPWIFELDQLNNTIQEALGFRFNLKSPKQLREILYDKLQLTEGHKTKKGKVPSTDDVALTAIKDQHSAIPLILEYRGLVKLISTYIDSIIDKVVDGRIHPKFHQVRKDKQATRTGRLSSSDPNFQNIPIRTEDGQKIRKAFTASMNHMLIKGDYAQLELMVIASISKDKNMLSAFLNEEDIHTKTSLIPALQRRDYPRRDAKTANFAIVYGGDEHTLAEKIGCSLDEGKEIRDGLFRAYPSIEEWISNTRNFAKANGYTQSIFGRRRPCYDVQSTSRSERERAYREAVNHPIQSTAADICKLAMIAVSNIKYPTQVTPPNLVGQVHDEILEEVEEHRKNIAVSNLRWAMESVNVLDIPLKADIAWGYNWAEMEKL